MQKTGIFCTGDAISGVLKNFNWKRTMRIGAFIVYSLLGTGALLKASPGRGQASDSKRLSISYHNTSLSKVLSDLERKADVIIMYEASGRIENRSVTISLINKPLSEILDSLVANKNLKWSIKDNIVRIHEDFKYPATSPSPFLRPPPITVRGRIINEKGQPEVASVIVKGTKTGTTSNSDGYFELAGIDEKAVLIISGVNIETYETAVKRGANFIINVVTKTLNLNEVVVNKGYYTEKQRLSTGNVSKVTAEEIARQPVVNPLQALQGKVPGMLVTQSTGLPGGSFKVEVRGRTAIDRTITDDQPLFIIDGIPVASNNSYLSSLPSGLGDPGGLFSSFGGVSPFAGLNTSDIESIEVLKDADATSIYGSRGANGVVLITTKKGKGGKTTISINAYTGFSEVVKPIKTLNTSQYVALRETAFLVDNVVPQPYNSFDIRAWDTTRYTDFNKLLGRNKAYTNDVNVSLSGGNNGTTYIIGGSFHRETTVLPGRQGQKRGTMHFSIQHESLDKKFNVLLTGNYSANENTVPHVDFAQYWNLPPNLKLYENDGSLAFNEGGVNTGGTLSNPMAYFKQRYTATTGNLVGNLSLGYELAAGLVVRVDGGYNNILTEEIKLSPASSTNPLANLGNLSNFGETQYTSYRIEPQIDYTRQLGKSKFNLLLGSSVQSTNTITQRINASGQPSEALLESFVGAKNISGSRSNSPYRYNAFFGRINYNLNDRYLLNLTARRDGSSRFGSDKQFANFGAAGAAWIFSDESFMQNLSFLSFGKLRGSLGLTGNDKIANYQFLDTWTPSAYNYFMYSSLVPAKLFNPDYRWEKTIKREIALELGFLGDRLQLTAAWYNNSSSNQLVQYKLPQITGFASIVANLPAEVVNKGWEMVLSSRNIKRKDFSWSTNFNITIPKSVLHEFPTLDNSSYKHTYIVGRSLNLIYNYQYTGMDAATGLFTFRDLNNDGLLDADDYVYNGTTDPKFYGGFNNTLTYKNLQLDLFFSFRKQTGKSYVASVSSFNGPGKQTNIPVELNDFWTKPGDDALYQRPTQGYGLAYTRWDNYINSNAVYTDASFIRLSNASLSYTLPSSWTSKARMSTARIFIQAQNLFTITGYEVGDPETQNLSVTPPLRTIVGGIQLNF